MPRSDQPDPDELARREFSRSRKGLDPIEVRAHLHTMADEIKRLRRSEQELTGKVSSLSGELERHDAVDESTIAQVLGEETVRVIEAARTAASEIKARAEESSGRLVREAQERANRMQQEATDLRAAAARDSDDLVASARTRSEEMLADARRESEEMRRDADLESTEKRERASRLLAEKTDEAEAEAARINEAAAQARSEADDYAQRVRNEADEDASSVRSSAEADASRTRTDADEAAAKTRADAAAAADRRAEEAGVAAEAEVERAREQGRTMVREAREARERMLRDLAERRRAARQQLEALRAGRERMLEVFAGARETLDEMTEGFTESLAVAREAADEAARDVDDDLDAAVAELDSEIPGGVDDDFEVAPASDDVATGVPATGDVPRPDDSEPTEPGSDEETPAAGTHDQVDSDGEELDSADTDEAGESKHLRLLEGGALEDDLYDDDEDEDEDEDDEDEADGGDDVDDGSTAHDDGGSDPDGSGNVEEIFARLRAGRGSSDELDADGPAAEVIPLVTAEVPVVSIDEAEAGSGADEPDDGPAVAPADGSSALDRRDDALGDIEIRLVRLLKKQAGQHENQLLDRLRKVKKSTSLDSALGDAESFVAAFVSPSAALVEAAFRAGTTTATGAGPDELPESLLEELDARARQWVSEPLRERLERILLDPDARLVDRTEVLDRLRGAYRDFRNDRLTEVAGDLVTFAFSKGVMRASPEGSTLCWVVDNGGLPCPDAEDNRLAGAVAVGDAYPTGDLLPPAHPGCRCILAPTD